MIKYLKHSQINTQLWNETVTNSENGLVYGQTWFMDIVSPGWEALVDGDYESVMPLPVKRKYFLPYLIQPKFTQQLGVFSRKKLSNEQLNGFIGAIPLKFLWSDFNFNYHNGFCQNAYLSQRVNYELDLNRSYEDLRAGYNENSRRNLSKAKRLGITIERPLLPDDFLEYYSLYAKVRPDAITYFQLKKIVEYALSHKLGEIIVAYNEKKQMLAGAFFLIAMNRVIYLTSFSCEDGKDSSAMFLVMDEVIQKHANQNYVLDFEGSMIPGIARFFEGFGSIQTTYFRYRRSIFRKYP